MRAHALHHRGGAGGSRSDSGGIDSDSDDGADDSDSNGADDAFAAEASDDARSPAASPGGSRSDSDNSNDGPGAALADSASHELSDGDAAACSAAYGSAVLRHCQRALQLLHDGGVRASTAAAAAPDARAGPFPLSDLILLARAAACSAAVPQLPTAARVRQACLRAGVQAADVIVDALRGIRSAVRARTQIDRRRPRSTSPPGSLRLMLRLRPRRSAHTGACAQSRSAPPLRAVGRVLLLRG